MKLYKKTLLILVALMLLSLGSCEKWLDQAPSGEQTKEYIFENYLYALRYIDPLYSNRISTWADGNRFGDTRGGLLESATDMAQFTASYGLANISINIGDWYQSAGSNNAQTREINRWANSYNNIRRCYMFLENMDQFNNDPSDYIKPGQDRKELMKGEVHFHIAWYYNELLKRYGGIPIITRTLQIDDNFQIPRSTYDETKEFILSHLDTAYAILPKEWPTADHGRTTKAAVLAFKARLLLYAASPLNNPANETQRWRDAADAARDVIEYIDSTGTHSLMANYQQIFMRSWPEQVSEIIIPAKRSGYSITFNSVQIRNNCATPGLPFQGFGSNTPTQNFVDRFEVLVDDGSGNIIGTEKFDWNNAAHVANIYKNRDPRFYYTVLYNDVFWIERKIGTWRDGNDYGPDINPKDHLYSRTGYYLKKYWPKECMTYQSPGGSFLAGFYYRYGEVLLSYAEAMNEVFGPDVDGLGKATTLTAREATNIIRARLVAPANADIAGESDPHYRVLVERTDNPDFPVLPNGLPEIPLGQSKDDFRDKIRNERVIELAFEDHYWYDILRWKLGEQHIGGEIYGADIVKSGSDFIITRKALGLPRFFDPNRMYRYPIPQKEIQVMGIEQNPGW